MLVTSSFAPRRRASLRLSSGAAKRDVTFLWNVSTVCCRVEGHHEVGVNARRTNLSARSFFCFHALLIDGPLCGRRVVLRSATYLTSAVAWKGITKRERTLVGPPTKPTCVMCDLKIGTSGVFNKLEEFRRRSGQHRVVRCHGCRRYFPDAPLLRLPLA